MALPKAAPLPKREPQSQPDKPAAATAPKPKGVGITDQQRRELDQLRVEYLTAKQTGSVELEAKQTAYYDYALDIGLHLSGKLDPQSFPDQEVAKPPPEPSQGYTKQGGWGASTDPYTWHVTPMHDPGKEDLYKLIDNDGKTVAIDFTTSAFAQVYVDYYKWLKVNAEPEPQPPPAPPAGDDSGSGATTPPAPTTTADLDSFGIKMIKPSLKGGRVETKFTLEGKERHYASGKASEYSCEYTNDSKTPIENVEVTIYQKINGFKNEMDTISVKLGGPAHKDGACCWLIPEFCTDGSAKKTMETEYPHPQNHPVNPKPLCNIGGSLIGKWFGYKAISQQTADNSKRHVESWIHFPVENIDDVKSEQDKCWRKYISIDIPDSRFYKASGSLTTSRLDGVKEGSLPDFKYASVREIVPVSAE